MSDTKNTIIDNLTKKNDLEDFKNQLDDIIKDLELNPDKVNQLTEEQAIEVDKYLNPYNATIYGEDKYTCISFTNLKEKYMQRLLTTGLIGFVYQLCDEYTIEDEELKATIDKNDFYEFSENPDKQNKEYLSCLEENFYKELKEEYYNSLQNTDEESKDNLDELVLSEDIELEIRKKVNEKIEEKLQPIKYFNNEKYLKKKEELITLQSNDEKKVINNFLNKLFKYNPKFHTTSVYNEDNNDPERKHNPNNKFTKNIPPNDTYCRFQYYYDVNYEELREAVMYLYNEKPDTEVAINIYETFDTLDECNEYINTNKDKVITNILTLTNYKWNLLGSFKKNRERITFYNENTKILENILKQQEEDAKMGKKLLDERVRKKKIKNVKEYGKTDPKVLQYLKENPNEITESAEKIEILEDKIKVTEEVEISEFGAKVDDEGTPLDAVEIGVTSINLKDNKVSTSKIYTKAHAPQNPLQ
jgi:hypothetical protein